MTRPATLNEPDCSPPQPAGRTPRETLPAGSCDTHVHVFGAPSRYPLAAGRNYTPHVCTLAQYRSVMHSCGIERVVLVQPSVYGTDNRCLLDALREGGPAFRGVVVPPAAVSDAEFDNMHRLGVRGIRLNLVNPQVLGVDEAVALCARIAQRGWHLQVQLDLAGEAEAQAFQALLRRLELPVVVDHMGRPAANVLPKTLLALLGEGRCWIKLSAPYRTSRQQAPTYDDVLTLARALSAANPDQVLWASDWPHTEQRKATPVDADLVDLLHDWLPDATLRARILIDNPARLYGY